MKEMWTDREEAIIKMIKDLADIVDLLTKRIEKLEEDEG